MSKSDASEHEPHQFGTHDGYVIRREIRKARTDPGHLPDTFSSSPPRRGAEPRRHRRRAGGRTEELEAVLAEFRWASRSRSSSPRLADLAAAYLGADRPRG